MGFCQRIVECFPPLITNVATDDEFGINLIVLMQHSVTETDSSGDATRGAEASNLKWEKLQAKIDGNKDTATADDLSPFVIYSWLVDETISNDAMSLTIVVKSEQNKLYVASSKTVDGRAKRTKDREQAMKATSGRPMERAALRPPVLHQP